MEPNLYKKNSIRRNALVIPRQEHTNKNIMRVQSGISMKDNAMTSIRRTDCAMTPIRRTDTAMASIRRTDTAMASIRRSDTAMTSIRMDMQKVKISTILPAVGDESRIQMGLPPLHRRHVFNKPSGGEQNGTRHLAKRRNGVGVLPIREKLLRNNSIDCIDVNVRKGQYRTKGETLMEHIVLIELITPLEEYGDLKCSITKNLLRNLCVL